MGKRISREHVATLLRRPLLAAGLAFSILALQASGADLYFGTTGPWTGGVDNQRWSTTAGGPYLTNWVAGSNAIFANGATITGTNASVGDITATADVSMTAGGTLTLNNTTFNIATGAAFYASSQAFSSSTLVTKSGGGSLSLMGSTFTSGFRLNAGTVNAIDSKAFGTSVLSIYGGTIQSSGPNARALAVSNVNVAGDFEFGGTNTGAISIAGDVDLGNGVRQVTVSNTTNTTVFSGAITGSSGNGFVKAGPGTLSFGGTTSNTYSGSTTVSAGTLSLDKSNNATAIAGNLTINGGTLAYGSTQNEQISDNSEVRIAGGSLNLGARSETIGQASPGSGGSFTLSSGSVTIGSGTLTLNRNASITGGTVAITSGTGSVVANQTLDFSGGTFDFQYSDVSNGAALSLRGGDGTGITYSSSGTSTASFINSGRGPNRISLNTSSGATTVFDIADAPNVATEMSIAVTILGNSGLTKQGAGKLVVSGLNTYTGATTAITGGTFVANTSGINANASAVGTSNVTVGDGTNSDSGTLAGTGFVGNSTAKTVTINKGGTITAGSGAGLDTNGTLTVTGTLAVNGGGTYAFKVGSTAGSTNTSTQYSNAGTGWDKLVMNALVYSSLTRANPFTIKISGLSSQTYTNGAKFEIANVKTGTAPPAADLSGISAKFVIDTAGLGLASSDFVLSSGGVGPSETGTYDLFLTYTGSTMASTPEPTTAALVGLSGSLFLGRRRRSRRNAFNMPFWLAFGVFTKRPQAS